MATPGDAGTPRRRPSTDGGIGNAGALTLCGAAGAVVALSFKGVASMADNAVTASGASLPRADTWTVSPPATSSAMIDTTLRAFASRSSLTIRMSDVNCRARAAMRAAGRA